MSLGYGAVVITLKLWPVSQHYWIMFHARLLICRENLSGENGKLPSQSNYQTMQGSVTGCRVDSLLSLGWFCV